MSLTPVSRSARFAPRARTRFATSVVTARRRKQTGGGPEQRPHTALTTPSPSRRPRLGEPWRGGVRVGRSRRAHPGRSVANDQRHLEHAHVGLEREPRFWRMLRIVAFDSALTKAR